jgi:hypothetical protein
MRSTVAVALFAIAMTGAACSDDSGGTSDSAEPARRSADPAPAVLGPELVTEGGFESGDAAWLIEAAAPGQVAQLARDDDGNSYIEMSADLDEDALWPQAVQQGRVRLIAGEQYRLSLRARSDDFGLVFTSVAFEDASGDEFLALGPGSLTVDGTEWMDYHFDFEAPEGTAAGYVILRLALNTAMTDEPFLSADVDDVSLRRIEG